MKDRYENEVRVGDVVTIDKDRNPHHDPDRVFRIDHIGESIRKVPVIYVEGTDIMLSSREFTLYARKIN